MRKFQTIIFYDKKESLDNYLHGFHFEKPIIERHLEFGGYIEYEHFEIRYFKKIPSESMRGAKCDLVAVEKSLFDMKEFEDTNPITCCMLAASRFGLPIQVF